MVQIRSQARKAKPKQQQEARKKTKISAFIKKKPKHEQTKRDNTYVFEGFYDKLKAIDVKHAHSMSDANQTFDRLLEEQDLVSGTGVEAEDQQLFRSNFIQLLRAEKAHNKTSDFSKVFSDLEGFCFSYPLLVHNKGKVVDRLLSYLDASGSQKVVQCGVVDLFVALVKDFRADIYEDFMSKILPKVVGSIDISNVDLMDKVFTLVSFAVKYLTKSIKEDLNRFYTSYSELLIHRNKFVRKFSA